MKVLILTESIAGTGHYQAAKNVAKGIAAVYPHAQIEVDQSLTHVNPFLERMTSKLYMGTIQHAAKLWGWAYQREREWSLLTKQALRKYIARKLQPYLEERGPDVVVSTHAFCLGGLAELKKKTSKPFRLGVALTDYSVNPFWIHSEIDHYFVGAMELKSRLIDQYGVSEKNIFVTGIPIDPCYSQRLDPIQARVKLNLQGDLPLCLVMGGGLGLVPFIEILKGLAEMDQKVKVCVITGTNTKAKEQLERWLEKTSYPHPVYVKEYVSNMDEWMSAADLLIGKPGGLTVSEALACGLPLLIYKPIPGQEERNSQFLMDSQLALRVKSQAELPQLVDRFLADQQGARLLKQQIAKYSMPDAAYQVGKILCGPVE
ncbi:hypothetical protein BEP19_00365 [Ammoniphilus oxalaticus]|uniref:Galactosyldiacylglycerol synthase n=1 Tax=Ammoniphilus oxalaticus TaxID=66863 RepID=A0A419SRB7_9BACL|nr:glycosyltransferase [Ammoniphilus oxalaticus]RKD27062.1 hypothetical protein BEP19_00365 [Ammoniphilus oxalaticus]